MTTDPNSAAQVARYCREFAASHPEVPVYARIAAAAADDISVLDLLRSAAPGQARPVLLLAALHDLVIRRPEVQAARWICAHPPPGDPWPAVRATLLTHAAELRAVIADRSTQTNEVNRAGYVLAMVAAACADLPDTPISLLELGASAGLLLNFDRYQVRIGAVTVGPPDSPVHCRTMVEGAIPSLTLPPILARAGIDRFPVAPDDLDALRWLRACLWPEVPGRVERFEAAVRVLRRYPPTLATGDMVDGLPALIEQTRVAGTHLVAYSSWAITYLAREQRSRLLEVLAGTGGPVSLVTAEPPGALPGLPGRVRSVEQDRLTGTDVWLHRWRGGHTLEPRLLARVHPHGVWLRWA